MHIIAPAEELARNPLKNSVAILSLRQAARLSADGGSALPDCASRLAVTVDGTETEEEVASLKVRACSSCLNSPSSLLRGLPVGHSHEAGACRTPRLCWPCSRSQRA